MPGKRSKRRVLTLAELSKRYDRADTARARAWDAYAASGETDNELYRRFEQACQLCDHWAYHISQHCGGRS